MSDIKELNDRQSGMINEEGKLNLWDNEAVPEDGISNEVFLGNYPHFSIAIEAFADEDNNTEQDVTVNFEVSPDGERWFFCAELTERLPQGGDSKKHIFEAMGARYARLVRDDEAGAGIAYINAFMQAKP